MASSTFYLSRKMNIFKEYEQELATISALAKKHLQNKPKGDLIYKSGDTFKNLYLIISGSIKVYSINEQGDEQITSFHTMGDLIAFDAIALNEHLSFAETLEDSLIGEVPFAELMALMQSFPKIYMLLLKLMSTEITHKKNLTMLISRQTAEQRIAYILLNTPFNQIGNIKNLSHIHLVMTREEIGKYLSLSIETVSRTLTNFAKQQIIKVSGRDITILNSNKLLEIITNNP